VAGAAIGAAAARANAYYGPQYGYYRPGYTYEPGYVSQPNYDYEYRYGYGGCMTDEGYGRVSRCDGAN
jgi:hypothetical protein